MNRRNFLQRATGDLARLGIALSLGPAFFSCNRAEGDEYFLACDGREFNYHDGLTDPRPLPPSRGYARIFNLRKREISEMRLPFRGHFIASNPVAPNRVFTSFKWGACAVEFDFMSKQILRQIEARPGTRFAGHAVYSRDGRHLFVSQIDDVAKSGGLAILDTQTYRVVDELSTFGGYPHECALHPTEDAIYVMNAGDGTGSSLALLSLRDGKLLSRVEMGNKKGQFFHAHVGQDQYVLAGGVWSHEEEHSTLSAVIDPSGAVSHLNGPELEKPLFASESLSIATNEKLKLVAFVLPEADRIQVWNYERKTHVRSISLKHPTGIALSQREGVFVVSEGHAGGGVRFLDNALEALGDFGKRADYHLGNGSHMARVLV
jgi:hypothetical protein